MQVRPKRNCRSKLPQCCTSKGLFKLNADNINHYVIVVCLMWILAVYIKPGDDSQRGLQTEPWGGTDPQVWHHKDRMIFIYLQLQNERTRAK